MIARYLTSTSGERLQARQIDAVVRKVELAEAQVAGIGHVSKRAMLETAQTNLMRQEAERLAPDAAELYAMIAVASVVEMTTVISRMNRPDRRV